MARRLTQAEIDATRAASSDAERMQMSRGGTLDEQYGPGGGRTSIGGGPGEDAPALRALARSFRDVQALGAGQGFSADNPYVASAVEASRPGMGGTMGGGDFQNMRDVLLGRLANDAFAYENAKRRADQMTGLAGVRDRRGRF